MDPASITIYHNPACGTSRNVLSLLRASGHEPRVIEYLKAPPEDATLANIISRLGMSARDLLRLRGTPYEKAGLDVDSMEDDAIIRRMVAEPLLINRPIVVAPSGARLCRPSDLVLELLAVRPARDLRKEDGSPVLIDVALRGEEAGLRAALAAEGLPTDDLAEPGRQFYAYSNLVGERLGYGGLEVLDREALLRSIVIAREARNEGAGGGVLALLLRRAFDAGARRAWLLTTTAAAFFERKGFVRVERGDVPAAILASREARDLCPSSATVLMRPIEL